MMSEFQKTLMEIFKLSDSEFHNNLTKDEIVRWDSLGHINLVTKIEKQYGVRFSIEEILELNSINDIILLLKKHGVCVEK